MSTHAYTEDQLLDRGLSPAYTPPVFQQKCAVLFEHVFESAATA